MEFTWIYPSIFTPTRPWQHLLWETSELARVEADASLPAQPGEADLPGGMEGENL